MLCMMRSGRPLKSTRGTLKIVFPQVLQRNGLRPAAINWRRSLTSTRPSSRTLPAHHEELKIIWDQKVLLLKMESNSWKMEQWNLRCRVLCHWMAQHFNWEDFVYTACFKNDPRLTFVFIIATVFLGSVWEKIFSSFKCSHCCHWCETKSCLMT